MFLHFLFVEGSSCLIHTIDSDEVRCIYFKSDAQRINATVFLVHFFKNMPCCQIANYNRKGHWYAEIYFHNWNVVLCYRYSTECQVVPFVLLYLDDAAYGCWCLVTINLFLILLKSQLNPCEPFIACCWKDI